MRRGGGALNLLLQHDAELIAAEPGDGVLLAERCTQPARDTDQNLVAGLVAEHVVHGLESIEVQEQHRDRSSLPARTCDRVLQLLDEQRPVRQSGERIVERLMLKLVPALLQPLGHRVEGASHSRELIVAVHVDPVGQVVAAELSRRLLQGLQRSGDRAIHPPREHAAQDEPEEKDR